MKPAPSSSSLLVLLALVCGTSALGQAAPRADKPAFVPALDPAGAAHAQRVLFDAPGDGSIWVRGAGYKAGFDARGARIVPWLGSAASGDAALRLFPVALAVGAVPRAFDGAVPAVRDGDSVVFERGSFRERYAARPTELEQTFVFDAAPGAGEIVLRIGVETALAARADDSGLRFECDLGGLTYSRAVALDSVGRRLPLATRLVDGAIEIGVPAEFVEQAVFPLTIDPIITGYTIAYTTADTLAPDVAHDPATDHWIACYEEVYSATDTDVFAQIQDANGAIVAAQYIDFTTVDWRHARVANNAAAGQFLVVAHAGGAPARSIVSRLTSAAFGVLGSQTTIAPSGPGWERVNPDVGGDPNPTGDTNFLVVFEQANQSGERWIVQQLVRSNGVPDSLAATCIDCNPGLRFNPAISKSAGLEGSGVDHRWNIAWEYEYDAADHDIYGAQLTNALTVTPTFAISLSFADERRPSVSSYLEDASTPSRYLVAYERSDDIMGQVIDGSQLVTLTNLSALGVPDYTAQVQAMPDVDSDGCTFQLAYSELFSSSTTDFDPFMSTFAQAGNTLAPIETRERLASTGFPEIECRIAARRASGPLRTLAVWTMRASPTDGDIFGAQYETPLVERYCFPALNGVIACPCANTSWAERGCDNSAGTSGALLTAAGTASLADDTFVLTQSGEMPSAISIFLQGDADIPAGTVFGGGVRCAGGSLKRLYLKSASGGVVSAPDPEDPTISAISAALGDAIPACNTRYYQVYYRDPNLGFCAAGFNVGSALKVVWVP